MKFDLSQFAELDRNELLEITGGYYGTQNIYVPDSYVYANASQSYRDSVNNGTQSQGSSYGYVSSGGRVVAASSPVTPVGYLVPTSGGGHYYTDGQGYVIGADGKRITDGGGDPFKPGDKEFDDYINNSNRSLQSNKMLNDKIEGSGCAFLATLYAVEEAIRDNTGKDFHFSLSQINKMYENQQGKLLNEYANVLGGYEPLANYALSYAGYSEIKCKLSDGNAQTGSTYTIIRGTSMYTDSNGENYTHIQLGDSKGGFLSDSFGNDTIPGVTETMCFLNFVK